VTHGRPVGPEQPAGGAGSESDAEALFEDAPCGYLVTTADGTIVRVNRTLSRMLGYAAAELVGRRRFADLLTVGGRLYHETHFAPMLALQASTHTIALELVRADEGRVPILVSSTVERAGDGRVVRVRSAILEASERRSYEHELLLAKQRAEAAESGAVALSRTLQQTLIPPALPSIPGLEVAAVFRPAGDGVSGDFYDVFAIAGGDWVVTIGDVTGKGAGAAVVTALVRYTLRAATVGHPLPSSALRMVNEVLVRDREIGFCTVALLRLSRRGESWGATVACAGHPLPLLRRRDGGVAELGRAGSMLGVFERPSFHDVGATLSPGDVVLLYTDGITEGRRDRDFYGEERLAGALAGAEGDAASIAGGVLADVMAFQGDVARDDIAAVAARVPG
jgi:sigma-B regulation protein RsbU (phosphoserine phosphatase)